MPRMSQTEIDEISDSFMEAWEEFFGDVMYYVPFDETGTVKNPLYGESKGKKYKFDERLMFHGAYKEDLIEEAGELGGRKIKSYGEVTFITKELRDQGLLEFDTRALIQRISRDGHETLHNIIGKYGKVQLVDNYVITKLRVIEDA